MTQDLDALPLPERPEARDMDYARFGYDADDMDFYGRACLIEGYELAMRKAQEGREPVAWRIHPKGWAPEPVYDSPPPKSDEARDAERYRWLRAQHEGHEPLSYDADGFPMPLEPTALAFTVFRPDRGSLEPVGCIPGELDAAIDAALAAQQPKGEA